MGQPKKRGMAIEEMTATSRLQDLHAYLLGVTRLLMDWMRVTNLLFGTLPKFAIYRNFN